jgi:hypothetical protein
MVGETAATWVKLKADVRRAINELVQQWTVVSTDDGVVTIEGDTGQRTLPKIKGTRVNAGDEAIVYRRGRTEVVIGAISTPGVDDTPASAEGGGVTDHEDLDNIGTNNHSEIDAFIALFEDYITDNDLAVATKLATADAPELIRDTMGTALVAGTNMNVTANDGSDIITITNLITTEVIRDTIGTALVAGAGVTITVDDAGDDITIAASAAGSALGSVTTTQTTTVDTAANVTGMSFAVGANEIWAYEFNLQIGCNGVGGVKFAFTLPTSPDLYRGHGFGNAGSGSNFRAELMSASGTLTGAFATFSTTSGLCRLTGTIDTGANAGTVQLQFASTTAGQTSSVYAGSSFRAWKVA